MEDRVGSSSGTLLGSGTYTVNYGTTTNARSLRSVSYTGYTYSSNSGNKYITSATTLYNYFTANSYNIYYYGNDSNGTISNLPTSGSISYNSSISSSIPTNIYRVIFNANGGYCSTSYLDASRTFNNWNTLSNGSGTTWHPGDIFSITSPLYLYAQWLSVTSITLPSATRTNYDFLGWSTSPTASSGQQLVVL